MRRRWAATTLAVAVGGFMAGAPGRIAAAPTDVLGAQPIYRDIKNWVVACDNTRACFAKYVGDGDDADDGGYLSIRRDAGPDGRLVVTIEDYLGEAVPDPRSLRLDGKPLAGNLPWRVDRKEQAAVLEGAPALQFVRSISEGHRVTYARGKARSTVSLSGMKAVLLAIDEDQGRLDTATALVRIGAKPPGAAYAAVPVPVVQAAPPPPPLPNAAQFTARVRRAHGALLKQHECEPDVAETQPDQAFALDKEAVLVVLGCTLGVYQGSSLVFQAPRAAPERARLLVLPPPPTEEDTALVGEVTSGDWDPKTSTLSDTALGRGLADCGSGTSWTYDGRRFVVSKYNALFHCGGPPGDWPTVYRTRVVPGR